jgi:hypothetical protein
MPATEPEFTPVISKVTAKERESTSYPSVLFRQGKTMEADGFLSALCGLRFAFKP